MKLQYVIFVGLLLVAVSSYVTSHEDITTFAQLMQPMHFFGLLGVIGSVIGAFFTNSNGSGLISKITGSGKQPLPPDVN